MTLVEALEIDQNPGHGLSSSASAIAMPLNASAYSP
jgi:hypothetical protein